MSKKSKKSSPNTIVLNKKAKFDYFIEENYEAGLSLLGWEVKSLREAKVNLAESYIHMRDGEAWLTNCHISPLNTASTHVNTTPTRERKLLLHNRELSKLFGAANRDGYTIVPLALYWKKHLIKLDVGVAKGKKLHDKRATEKDKEWKRSKERILKDQNR
ncbi:MAG: SsrA-binding protein SmpB [Pseudomonadota bacterium]